MRRSMALLVSLGVAASMLSGCVVVGGSSTNGGGGGGFFFFFFFFLVLPLVMLAVFAYTASRAGRRRTTRSRRVSDGQTPNPQMVRAELSVLADDVLRLEPQVALHPEAREDFDAATHRYRVAQAAVDHAQSEDDLVRVQRVVDEGTWAMARARAAIDGRTPPAPPPQLQQPGPRGEPAVALDDRDAPTYVGSPAPFRTGWFGGGMLGGLFFGPLLGGFGGWVSGSDDEDDADDADDDGWT